MENPSPWINLYNKFCNRLRFLVGGLVLLAFTAFVDGFAYVSTVSENYQLGVDIILKEKREAAFREEIREIYSKFNKPGIITVDMKKIRPLYREYVRAVDAKSLGQLFAIGNVELGHHPYILMLVYGPPVLVAAMLWPLLSIRKLHRRLGPVAEPEGEIQQKLNSLFYDRVTVHYGEGWRRHVIFSLAGIFILAVFSAFALLSSRQLHPDLLLQITSTGEVSPVNDSPLNAMISIIPNDVAILNILILMVFTLLLVGIIVKISFSIPCQNCRKEEDVHFEPENLESPGD